MKHSFAQQLLQRIQMAGYIIALQKRLKNVNNAASLALAKSIRYIEFGLAYILAV